VASLSGLRASVRPIARAFLAEAARRGLAPRVESVRRSRELQKRLYARYLAGKWPYPVAKPGTSFHEKGLAFDLSSDLGTPGLQRLGALAKAFGIRWGGDFHTPDPIHFQFGP